MEPLEVFFRQYAWFQYIALQSASQQFERLRGEAGWERGDAENDEAWEGYLTALVRQFNTTYSNDDNDLDAWHTLLQQIGITDLPGTVEGCKKLISGKFINLIDLIDARHDPTRVIVHFPNEIALSEYTRQHKKIFPRNHVEAGSLLRYLLRNIMEPNPDRRDPAQSHHNRGNKKKKRRGRHLP